MRRALTMVVATLLVLAIAAPAQRRARRDPLTDAESEEMRDAARNPPKRIKLIIKFARARLAAIDQLRADPQMAAERGRRIHDLLQDFTGIVDELDDNVSMYFDKKWDVAKAVSAVVEAGSEFQVKMREIKESAIAHPRSAQEFEEYRFVLENATDAVNACLDNARDMQDALAKESKEEKAARKERQPE